jgi:hypothetical protein
MLKSVWSIRATSFHATLTNVYISCFSASVNVIAKWLVNLKDLRLNTLWIDEPFNEALQMKMLEHLYVGRISSEVGEYLVKLVAACPKV